MDVLYICDRKKKDCPGYGRCNTPGLDQCTHTGDAKHAVNGECRRPWMHPERFGLEVVPGKEPFYVEINREG